MVIETFLRVLSRFPWTYPDPLVFPEEFLVGVLTTIPFVVGIWYVGYWLPDSGLDEERYPRILRWMIRAAVVSVAFNLVLIGVIGVDSNGFFVAWLRWAAAVGSGLGLVVGVSEARAVQNSIETERAQARAEHLSRQRDLLDYLNGFLRHEILNTVQVIAGQSELLMDEHEPESDAYSYGETINRQSEDITAVVRDVRLLIESGDEEVPLERVKVTTVLRKEIRKVEDDHDVDVVASIPDDAFVRANGLLRHVFGNLLSNAVEHNRSDDPTVEVTVTTSPESVAVEVTDDGDGIPEGRTSDLFDRPDSVGVNHGLGLYLIGRLTAQYGGSVKLVETGPDGSVFRVVLPRCSESSGDSSIEQMVDTSNA